MSEISIRPLSRTDVVAVSDLARQLGYERSPAEVDAWIANAADSDMAAVAESEGVVVAWVHAHDVVLLQSPPRVEIAGMVVAEQMRGKGIGTELVEAVVEWARERHCTRIRVRSNVVRTDAHGFYEGLGFVREKTSHVFALNLD